MDANGLRFWMLADREHWRLIGEPTDVRYDAERRTLRLRTRRPDGREHLPVGEPAPGLEETARARLAAVAQTRDAFGTRAAWDAGEGAVRATGAVEGAVSILTVGGGLAPTDLALGDDGILYVALERRVVVHDLRGRWRPLVLRHDELRAWRLATKPGGGAWVLDRAHATLWRVDGQPFPERPLTTYSPATARPCAEVSNPPRLMRLATATWAPNETRVAIACSPTGRLALLTWADEGEARLRLLADDGDFTAPTTLRGARYPYDLAWTSADAVAVLVPELEREALVYALADVTAAEAGRAPRLADPVGDFYPLRGHDGGPFLNGPALPVHYPTAGGSEPLHPISARTMARRGEAAAVRPMDSGSAQTAWHRLYLEAAIPPQCAVRVFLAATTEPAPPEAPSEWHEHRFAGAGDAGAPADRATPRGAWVSSPSELPFHPGLLPCAPERDRAGLFTALIQRANRRVRTLRGRYLWARVDLRGDGRATPEVAALRAYGSRFSYVEHYLPEMYREWEFGAEAERVIAPTEPATSTPADFLERFVDNLEGILTPLEDRIAHAHLLTDPRTAPEEALAWLGGWIGVAFDPAYPPARRRELLAAAPRLFRRRGTLAGLRLALDVATGGACEGGEIVVLEDFRLRRTFATILGVDLADERDPLLGGLAVSGNSHVGDTLILGEEHRAEFLALFRADLPTSRAETAAVSALFERLAHRVTVFVHQEVAPQDLGLIRRVVALETPAHVEARVLTARHPFLVGVASLVGVDTYLGPPAERQPVRVGESRLGRRDFLQRPASLDPRLGGGAPPAGAPRLERPHAEPAELTVPYGASFALDASDSRAASGRRVTHYEWTMLE